MACTNENLNKILEHVQEIQQQYYELLPEWTLYQQQEYKYLQQNIGFAIYGLPTKDKQICTIQDKLKDTDDIADIIFYDEKAKILIDTVYQKVLECHGDCESSICYGVIYNIIFSTKNDPAIENMSDISLYQEPIFKVWKQSTCQLSYIDKQGRIYADWSDYKKNNTLPQCTMALPKDGVYQCDPSFSATIEYSKVLLDIVESPACSKTSVFLNHMDKVSVVTGIAGIGCSIATCFTPAAPFVIGATACSLLNGAWTIGRSTQNLVDKKSHQESLTDRSAFGSWLAVSGSMLGLATSGGSALLSKFAQNGSKINKTAQAAYNFTIFGNLGINGFGIGYQAYCMYENYQNGQSVSVIDVVSLTAHILFFGNAVLNVKTAGQLIDSAQENFIRDYRATLRSRHLRKAFNRAKRNAANTYTNKHFENAEVIRYINRKLSFNNQASTNKFSMFSNIVSTKDGKIIIKDVPLLDPNRFVSTLMIARKIYDSYNKATTSEQPQYTSLLQNLLASSEFNDTKTNFPELSEMFKELSKMVNGQDIFILLFQITIAVIKYCPTFEKYLYDSLHFMWNYIKQSIEQVVPNINFSEIDESVQQKIYEFMLSLLDVLEIVAKQLMPALQTYTKFVRSVLNKTHV